MAAMAVREAMKTGKRPPGLRKGDAKRRCGTCRYHRTEHRHGMCQRYRYPTEVSQVCTAWAA